MNDPTTRFSELATQIGLKAQALSDVLGLDYRTVKNTFKGEFIPSPAIFAEMESLVLDIEEEVQIYNINPDEWLIEFAETTRKFRIMQQAKRRVEDEMVL